MKIMMPRGDLKAIIFSITDPVTQEASDAEITEIFFTVKKRYDNSEFLFQKKLSDGSIVKLDNSEYQFMINPEDTDNLAFGAYVFDIELVGPSLKDTTLGELQLTHEVTHAYNE